MTDGTKFFGTTDAQPLNFRVNNIASGRIDHNILIGEVSLGYGAAANTNKNSAGTIGTKNTAIGYQNLNLTIHGVENTAVGYQSMASNVSGSGATAIGFQALGNAYSYTNNTSEYKVYNTAVGYQALQGNSNALMNSGNNNTALGHQSLKNNTTGSYNTGAGVFSLNKNTSGANNLANGYYSLYNNTTGNYNIAQGSYALQTNTTGTGNIGLGYNTLSSNSTGNYNIAIGYGANVADGLTNAIAIGQSVTNSTSNSIVLGNSNITKLSTAGAINTSNTTNSTSVSTGALIIAGGAGIAKDAVIGGNTIVTGSITSSSDIVAKHIKGNSGTPSITTQPGAGTSPTSISVVGTDMSGYITLTTGSSPSINSTLATIGYSSAFSTAPVVVITPANAATASLVAAQAVWVNIATANFTINTNATALAAGTIYKWNYVVIQ